MKRLDKTSTKVWKELTNEQLNMVRMGVDYGNRQLEILLSRETPANLLAAQSGIAMEFSMKYMDQCRRVFALLTDTGSESNGLFQPVQAVLELDTGDGNHSDSRDRCFGDGRRSPHSIDRQA